MRIRDATRGDVSAIVELLSQDGMGSRRESPTEPLPEDYWSAFDAIGQSPDNRIIVIEDDEEVVGTLQLSYLPHLMFRGGWRAQVEAVFVAAHRRGEGLGRQLFDWVVSEARERGCHLVQLTMHKSRADARRFYESLGFEASHEGMKLYLAGDADGR